MVTQLRPSPDRTDQARVVRTSSWPTVTCASLTIPEKEKEKRPDPNGTHVNVGTGTGRSLTVPPADAVTLFNTYTWTMAGRLVGPLGYAVRDGRARRGRADTSRDLCMRGSTCRSMGSERVQVRPTTGQAGLRISCRSPFSVCGVGSHAHAHAAPEPVPVPVPDGWVGGRRRQRQDA